MATPLPSPPPQAELQTLQAGLADHPHCNLDNERRGGKMEEAGHGVGVSGGRLKKSARKWLLFPTRGGAVNTHPPPGSGKPRGRGSGGPKKVNKRK